MEDILFDYHTPAIGLPNAVEDEVRPAPPPYWRNQVLMGAALRTEAACAHLPRGVEPNRPIINVQPFGLPFGVWREPESPEGAIGDPLVDSAPLCGSQTRIPDAEIHAVLNAALHPEILIGDPGYQQQGGGALGSNQSPPMLPPTRANSRTGILHNGQGVPPRVPGNHLPPRLQPVRARPLGQSNPEPSLRAPSCTMVEPVAGHQVPHHQF